MTITAAILCGGRGERLRPVLGDLPKCLAPVSWRDKLRGMNEEPFLWYVIHHLWGQEVTNTVLCTGYGAEQVKHVMSWKLGSLKFSQEDQPLGTAGAVRLAYERGLLDTDPVLVVNGDTWCPFRLAPLLKWHKAKRAECTWLCSQPIYSNVGLHTPIQHAGVKLLSKKALEKVNVTHREKLELAEYDVAMCCTDAPFLDIGTPEGYAVAEDVING